MLASNYPIGVDRFKFVSGSNAYSMTNGMLLSGFLFRQIFTVVLFSSNTFAATVFNVGEKLTPNRQQPNHRIKEAIHIILTFLCTQIVVSGSCC